MREKGLRPRIKICCISSVEEARLAVREGASALGLVSAMPSGPGVIGWDAIRTIAAAVPPGVATFLLTSSRDAEEVAEQVRGAGTGVVQLTDTLVRGSPAELRRAVPGVKIVQVVHVTGEASVEEAARISGLVDALLLDSGNPALDVKELGGTGRVHDWRLSRRIRDAVDVPLFLAGGLRPDNVARAVGTVRPWGVDVCTGVRTDGRLDPEKLRAFVAAAEEVGRPGAGPREPAAGA